MNLERYDYSTNEKFLNFVFFSEEPKGKVKKVVNYIPQNANGITYFNLGFGDWDEEKRPVDDTNVTNNSDSKKVLATVAATVLFVTEHFPDAIIYAKGRTPARTRLYQIGISANWNEIDPLMNVYGYLNKRWYRFEKNINYEAFMAIRK